MLKISSDFNLPPPNNPVTNIYWSNPNQEVVRGGMFLVFCDFDSFYRSCTLFS